MDDSVLVEFGRNFENIHEGLLRTAVSSFMGFVSIEEF